MANTGTRRRARRLSDEEAQAQAEAQPTILTTVRMPMSDGGPAELFHPGQEKDLIDFLDEVHGDGDEENGVKSKDDVLVYLTRKGYIANFDVDDELLEEAQALTIDQRLERRWRRQKQEQEDNGGEMTNEQRKDLDPRSVVPPTTNRRARRTKTTESDDGRSQGVTETGDETDTE